MEKNVCTLRGGTDAEGNLKMVVLMRPFELEIVREIRTPPRRPGAGGRSIPRKGVWIRGHLQDVGSDYVYRMYKRWRSLLEEAGLNIKAGTYQQFRTYIYVLKQLGLVERVGGSPSSRGFPKTYYALNPHKVNSPIWRNPFKHYSRGNIP